MIREKAIKILCLYEKTGELKSILDKFSKRLKVNDKALLRELVLGVVRYKRLLDYILEQISGKKISSQKLEVRNALRLIAYQFLFTNIPPYAIMNETLNALKRFVKQRKSIGFVNAVGRKISKLVEEKKIFDLLENEKDPFERICIKESFPTWMAKRWKNFYLDKILDLGKEGNTEEEKILSGTQKFLNSLNQDAPLWLRVNRLKIVPEAFERMLIDANISYEKHEFIPDIYKITQKGIDIYSLPGYKEGLFYIQDPASYLAVKLLDPKPGEKILDLCAAPGGKTLSIAHMTGNNAQIYAVDINAKKILMLEENLKKYGATNVKVLKLDITKDYGELENMEFDKILIDAPCSGTGVIRRHPEGKWNKSLELIEKFQGLQRKLLQRAYKLLKPGGRLLYTVCSLEKEEGEENNDIALKHMGYKEASFGEIVEPLKEDIKKNTLRTFPFKYDLDGFFYAIYTK